MGAFLFFCSSSWKLSSRGLACIQWGAINIQMDEHTFEINRERTIDYLNTRDNVYVFDGFAGVRFLLAFLLILPSH